MGWEGSKRVFLQFLTLCACVGVGWEQWDITQAWILPWEENRHRPWSPTKGQLVLSPSPKKQFFITPISPLVSNTLSSSLARWSQFQRIHAAGKLHLPKNPTK